jgi:hypothetical protein
MRKGTMSAAAAAALLALCAPAARAYQGEGAPMKSPPVPSGAVATGVVVMAPGPAPASRFIGALVYDSKGDCVGPVEYVILAPNGTELAAAIVNVGMFLGSKDVAVGASELAWRDGRLTVLDRSRRDLQRTASYTP